MKLFRIYGLILRYMIAFRHSFDRMMDVFYWPLVDLVLWGITGSYIRQLTPNGNTIVLAIIAGILLWILVWRAQYEVSGNLLMELWDKNLINLFVAPIKFSEWVTSFLLVGIGKALISIIWGSLIAYFIFHVTYFFIGFYIIPLAIILFIFGWSIGFFIAGIILRGGSKVQTLAWTVIWAVSPFSAVYYPISILPKWAQQTAQFFPTSYVFENTRALIVYKHFALQALLPALLLAILYFVFSLCFLKRSFIAVLNRGLVKIT